MADSQSPTSDGRVSELSTAAPELVVPSGVTFQPRQILAGRYEIISRLGQGGMGEVWQAYDLKLRVNVALKSVRLDHRASEQAVEALRREVRTAREVVSPNVCRIFDLVVEERQELISMEYVDGYTLTAVLCSKGPLELREARDIASQFLAGLEAIHQAGLVHRDFKPENVMITRTGRVVVMDFGIAKHVAQLSGTMSGTPPYMAPELLSGGTVDQRSDVFAAGVVLAEMINPKGARDQESRTAIWSGIRQEPPEVADTPWRSVICRATAKNPEDRYATAQALARALEEVTQRVDTVEERRPYPGLAPFTEANSEYFFGRELEVETGIKKLQQLHLMALIGPSGAGKTSFLQAGLIPALPEGWGIIFCQPGDAPLLNLAHALVPELSGDTEAIHKLVRLEDIGVALRLLERWRTRHQEALLIVDRFEELFTLNPPEVQSRFAELLGRAPLDANVRVVLSMRDDFLFHCHDYADLAPIFSELTPLGPLSGPSLRRALLEPALKCGYRFEDEALVDEIVKDVDKERGALPLMAFAASRLWEKRDRQSGLLTRTAYQEIGGVAGALAQHAETTMESIGAERHDIVRELFRNLVTAQGTRCVRDAEELVSIFQDRHTGEEVLRALIDARLLTSFEALQQEGGKPKSRVEIIHESLLSAWPRLVRWQTQDTDSAQLRDQLRQAAQMWNERNRPEDMLWTGTSYKEFEVWRERYGGGLSATEAAFAEAMAQRAGKQRRRRRIAVSTIVVVLLFILGVVGNFWRGEKTARKEAVSEARRAEASKLLALGRVVLNDDPSTSLAYSLASLELADTSAGRHFALEALYKGPPALILEMGQKRPTSTHFSSDGKSLAVGGFLGVWLVSASGSVSVATENIPSILRTRDPQLGPDGDTLVWRSANDTSIVRVWSLSRRKEVRKFKMEGPTACLVRGTTLFLFSHTDGDLSRAQIRSWAFDHTDLKLLGRWNLQGMIHEVGLVPTLGFDVSPDGEWLGYAKGRSIVARRLQNFENSREHFIGEHSSEVQLVRFHPKADQVASADSSGQIRIWSLMPSAKGPIREIAENDPVQDLVFNPPGSILASVMLSKKTIRLWRLDHPLGTDPILIPVRASTPVGIAFDPTGKWAAVPYMEGIAFFSLSQRYPYLFPGSDEYVGDIGFSADGKSLAVSGEGIRLLPLPGMERVTVRNLWKAGGRTELLAMDPLGRYLLVGTHQEGAVLVSIADGNAMKLPNTLSQESILIVAVSPDGRLTAGSPYHGEGSAIQVWNLASGEVQVLEKSRGMLISTLVFSPDGSLFSGDIHGNLLRWDLESGSSRMMRKGRDKDEELAARITKDGRRLIVLAYPSLNSRLSTSELIVYDLRNGKSRPITSHGNHLGSVAVDPEGTVLATVDVNGIVRIGPLSGEQPHLLLGNENGWALAVDPRKRWVAASEMFKPVVRLWPMPTGRPFHTLPHNEFLDRLRALTNVRVVADKNSSTGYVTKLAPFPGWEKMPAW